MPPTSLLDHFQDLPDPRVARTRRHRLLDIVVIPICGVMAGAESWDDIDLFGESQQAWLQVVSAWATTNRMVFAPAVRSQWGIENQVHGVLDVTVGEDARRIRAGCAAENLTTVRHIALNLLRKDPSRRSLKGKRLKAALDADFLLRVLLQF